MGHFIWLYTNHMDKNIIGIIPLVLAVPSYAYYIYTICKRTTKPQMYSWLIWSVLAAIGYVAQVSTKAGPGAWNTGITAIVCFAVFLISIKYGDRKLSRNDLLLLCLAGASVLARLVTGDYMLAVLLTTIAALVGFTLTIKKVYRNPKQENALTFFLNGLRNLISMFALSAITFTTFFYPFVIMVANLVVVAVIIRRRSR